MIYESESRSKAINLMIGKIHSYLKTLKLLQETQDADRDPAILPFKEIMRTVASPSLGFDIKYNV